MAQAIRVVFVLVLLLFSAWWGYFGVKSSYTMYENTLGQMKPNYQVANDGERQVYEEQKSPLRFFIGFIVVFALFPCMMGVGMAIGLLPKHVMLRGLGIVLLMIYAFGALGFAGYTTYKFASSDSNPLMSYLPNFPMAGSPAIPSNAKQTSGTLQEVKNSPGMDTQDKVARLVFLFLPGILALGLAGVLTSVRQPMTRDELRQPRQDLTMGASVDMSSSTMPPINSPF